MLARYQEIAQLAVQWQRGHAQPPHGRGPRVAGGGGGGGGGSGKKDADSDGSMLHAAAQEVFRVALFAVFFLQVSAMAFVPIVGAQPALSLRCTGHLGRGFSLRP